MLHYALGMDLSIHTRNTLRYLNGFPIYGPDTSPPKYHLVSSHKIDPSLQVLGKIAQNKLAKYMYNDLT